MTDNGKLSKQEIIAAVASFAILTAGIIYWGVQVGNTYEMLSLAYGPDAISIWMPLIVLQILLAIHVLVSSRSHDGAKFGWCAAVLLFPLLGYIIFLIVTQPAIDANNDS